MRLSHYNPAIILAAATLFFAYDIVADLLDGSESVLHVFVESLVFIAISVVLFAELRRVKQLKKEVIEQRGKAARLSALSG